MHKINPLELIEEIYKKHYVYLRNFLIGLTKNDEVADDIIQGGRKGESEHENRKSTCFFS
ncbi:hypothetical protein [Halobacillus naozhouensis]|uniref:RNA polymerase sigma-70 factor, ECF subfamily n=1 Tax=Halobacillus naozhouensis TaxID=554880 RepID=A0ABY8J1Z4_9BACI|nr:hypothetical protein [Halobacillus naozhouensis]WFT76515.1 hypothetical protein P9989_09190 [Halobacillus naozhouensis]